MITSINKISCLPILLLLVLITPLFAQDREEAIPEILEKKISIILNEETLEDALKEIALKGDIKLNFNHDRIPIQQKITLKMADESIYEILQFIMELTTTELIIISEEEFIIVPSINQNKLSGKIFGKIINKNNQRALPGANIFIIETESGTITDNEGYFKIDDVPVGSYSIRVSFIGFKTILKPDVIVRSDRITFLSLELVETPYLSEEIIVHGDYFSESELQPTSAASFSSEEIRRAATLGGDVTRIINGLPSLSNDNEVNHIVARGGSTIENSFYVDNILISNINHIPFPGTTGGLFSILNIDFVKKIEMYTGGFSSRFGDRLSSVMNIKYREGNREEIDTQIDINFAGIGGQIEGPINGGKGSWMFSARHSFLDVMKEIFNEDINLIAFNELQGKVVYDLSDNHQISLLNIFSTDKYSTTRDISIDNYLHWWGDFETTQNILGLNWKYLWNKNGYSNTTASFVHCNNSVYQYLTSDNSLYMSLLSNEDEFRLRNENFLKLNNKNKIEFGIETESVHSRYSNFFQQYIDYFENFVPQRTVDKKFNIWKFGGFLHYEWNPLPELKLTGGLRGDYYSFNKNINFSPRFSFTFQMSEQTSFTGSAGIFYQNLPLYFSGSYPDTDKLDDPVAYHMILGLNHLFTESTKFTVEIYNKDYKHVPLDPKQLSVYLLDEPFQEYLYLNHENIVSSGIANSKGIEIMLQQKMSNNFYGIISAAFFKCKYRDPNGIWRDRIVDNKVLLAVEGGYKLDESWEFGFRWNYAGGAPYTPFNFLASITSQHGIYDTDKIMTQRLPAYQNFSIRIDKRFYFSGSNLILYLSVWNLFDRENISLHGWARDQGIAVTYKQMDRIAIFGVEFEF
ncbi:TonB-dependent receptor domain-containing protein [Bacteroidota bacterium]